MKRPWQVWVLFVLCSSMVVACMGWFTWTVLHLRHENGEALRQAAVEDVIRRALWRMEIAIAPVLIEESRRPYYDYNPFNPQETALPETRLVQKLENTVPSPLLTLQDKNANIYFQYTPGGELTSPQLPDPTLLDPNALPEEVQTVMAANGQQFNTFLREPR